MFKILICDDSCLMRLRLKKILEKEGHKVYESANLRQLEENILSKKISLENIDLIFLDVHLKNEKGYSLLKYIKKNNLLIPIIMVSGDNKRSTINKAFELGAIDYILKPFNENCIINHLNRIVYKNKIVRGKNKILNCKV